MNVRTAIKIIRSSKSIAERLRFLVWLLAWAFLDQRPGKRAGRTDKVRNAEQASRLVYQWQTHKLLERLTLPNYKIQSTDIAVARKYLEVGGPLKQLRRESLKTMLRRVRRHRDDYEIVCRIVHFLCRASLNDRKELFSLASAVRFLGLKIGMFSAVGERTVRDAWECFAPGAALIYAIHECTKSTMFSNLNQRRVVASLIEIARSRERTEEFLGYAAFAADALDSLRSTKAFTGSFKNIPPRSPKNLTPLTKEEIDQLV